MRQRTPPSELILFWSHVTSVFHGLSLSRSVRPVGENPGNEVVGYTYRLCRHPVTWSKRKRAELHCKQSSQRQFSTGKWDIWSMTAKTWKLTGARGFLQELTRELTIAFGGFDSMGYPHKLCGPSVGVRRNVSSLRTQTYFRSSL